MDREIAISVVTAGKPIPLARVESESQARSVSEALTRLGIKTLILSDESLSAASPPARLRSIAFDGDKLRLELFSGEIRPLDRDELVLIVPGVVIEGRSESVEKRKLLGTKVLSKAETSSYETVVDIYSATNPAGWRIPPSGFDYSCLGSEKSLIAAANMKILISKLSSFASFAKVIDDYISVRPLLETAWPSETERDTSKVGRSRKHTSSRLTSNNTTQLTRYSRLQWRLYEEKV